MSDLGATWQALQISAERLWQSLHVADFCVRKNTNISRMKTFFAVNSTAPNNDVDCTASAYIGEKSK